MSTSKTTTHSFDSAIRFDRDDLKVVYTPEFYKNFTCIAAECENTCCAHWSINLDRNTYKKFKQHSDIKIRQIAQKETKSARKDSGNYRQIKLTSHGNCPLLEDDKLCYLQKNYGEELLPTVCKVFPRENRLMEGELYLSLSLSCPEAARKILLDPSAMVVTPSRITDETELPNTIAKLAIKDVDLLQRFKQLASACVLAENSATVEGRLFNLGMLFRLASKRLEKGDSLHSLLNSFGQLIDSGDLNQMYQDTKPSQNAQAFILSQLLSGVGFNTGNPVILNYWQEAMAGLDEQSIHMTFPHFYAQYCHKNYEQLIDTQGFSFINLMLHWIYTRPFDLTSSKQLFDEYTGLVLKFFYIRTLCGLLYTPTEDNQSDQSKQLIVGIVHSVSRNVDNSQHFLNLVHSGLQQQGLTQPEHILGLIKV